MSERNEHCPACEGTGLLSDDEGWQYECSVCHGEGTKQATREIKVLEVDRNNRLLD